MLLHYNVCSESVLVSHRETANSRARSMDRVFMVTGRISPFLPYHVLIFSAHRLSRSRARKVATFGEGIGSCDRAIEDHSRGMLSLPVPSPSFLFFLFLRRKLRHDLVIASNYL